MRSTLSCPPHPSPGQRHVLAAAGFSGHSLWRFRRIARFGSKRVAAPSFETSASLTPNVSSSRRASYCKSTKARKVRLLFDLSPERRTARAILAEGPLHYNAQEIPSRGGGCRAPFQRCACAKSVWPFSAPLTRTRQYVKRNGLLLALPQRCMKQKSRVVGQAASELQASELQARIMDPAHVRMISWEGCRRL